MTLVDDDVAVVVGAKAIDEAGRRGALDRREQVLVRARLDAPDQQLAERGILKDIAERAARLVEELLAMGEEQEARWDAGPRALPVVIERGDHGLAGAG